MTAREHNRRVKQAIAMLKAAGAQHVAMEILADGTTRVVEATPDTSDDAAARLGALIEEPATSGVTGRAFPSRRQGAFRSREGRNDACDSGRASDGFGRAKRLIQARVGKFSFDGEMQ